MSISEVRLAGPIEAKEYVIGRSNRADLGSSNGTTVSGQKVQGSQALRSGDTIGVGEATLRFELS